MKRTVDLKTPLKIQTKSGEVIEEIKTITLYPLKGGDLLSAFDAAGTDKVGTMLAHLASRSSRLTISQIQALEVEDLFAVVNEVQSFFPRGLQIGPIVLNSSSEPSDIPTVSTTGGQDN
ncbi:MAG: phage tail assembly protein [Rhodospirillaceae bacterium]|nr:MAG: phage tail assembly protein [Rhodospirillaceae bacterium]